MESVLIVPLIGRSGVLGAISLSRHNNGRKAYKVDDQSFLMDIASRTALAIENCRLFESLRTEIAERLSTKQRLDSSEERFRAIFEATTLGIKVLDLDGNILQTNAPSKTCWVIRILNCSAGILRFPVPSRRYSACMQLVKELKASSIPQYLFEHRTIARDMGQFCG
jgi:hypothetical protein